MPAKRTPIDRLLSIAVRVAQGGHLTPGREMAVSAIAANLDAPAPGGAELLLELARAAREPGAFRRSLEMLRRTGVTERWLPELAACRGVGQNRFHAYDVETHILEAADAAGWNQPLRRIALLLHDIGKPGTRTEVDGKVQFLGHEILGSQMAQEIVQRMGFSVQDGAWIVEAVAAHMRAHNLPVPPTYRAVNRLVKHLTHLTLEDIVTIRQADKAGSGVPTSVLDNAWADSVRQASIAVVPVPKTSVLAVNGLDIQEALGIPAGPTVGSLLRRLEAIIAENPAVNTREQLLGEIPRIAHDARIAH